MCVYSCNQDCNNEYTLTSGIYSAGSDCIWTYSASVAGEDTPSSKIPDGTEEEENTKAEHFPLGLD